MPAASIPWGMDLKATTELHQQGLTPAFGTQWIGVWNLVHGWGTPQARLAEAAKADIIPVLHFYFWGDDISPAAIRDGTDSTLHQARKDGRSWRRTADGMCSVLQQTMAGRPVFVVVESEFNKNGVETDTAAQAAIARTARRIRRAYPPGRLVLGLGNWGPSCWSGMDELADATDVVGLQVVEADGTTRAGYADCVARTMDGITRAADVFGKPVFLDDVAFSSHPEPEGLQAQADAVAALWEALADGGPARGLEGVVYRHLRDRPDADAQNHFGRAERHWGLAWPDGTPKPAMAAWSEAVGR